jgi:hypothetical protein
MLLEQGKPSLRPNDTNTLRDDHLARPGLEPTRYAI